MFENRIVELRKVADKLEQFQGVFDTLQNQVDWYCMDTDEEGNKVPPTEDHWRYDQYMAYTECIDILKKALEKKYC